MPAWACRLGSTATTCSIGRPAFLVEWGVELPAELTAAATRLEDTGATVVAIASTATPSA